ncbi:MAG: hypothetical protein ACO3NK_01235 [Prochlorotrichaceae cyanobacterium]|jgi:hypothetical protein
MASDRQVRTYLACWFQLNRGVILHETGERLCPEPVVLQSNYSQAFEDCWTRLLSRQGQNCYLEGTNQTIAELMSESWDFMACPRCTLPIPVPKCPVLHISCPCAELHTWPNNQLPLPRQPLNSQNSLGHICERVTIASHHYQEVIEDAG